MKSYTAASFLGLAAVAMAATNSTVSPNLASCQSKYTQCSSGTSTDCANQFETCEATCKSTYETCIQAAGSATATCNAAYASCLGSNPFSANGDGVDVVTVIVPSYTTYCPYATSFVENGQTYVATGATTITVTNCPCTRTSTVTGSSATGSSNSGSGSGSGSNSGSGSGNSSPGSAYSKGNSSSIPESFQGAATKVVGLSLAALAGASGLFAVLL